MTITWPHGGDQQYRWSGVQTEQFHVLTGDRSLLHLAFANQFFVGFYQHFDNIHLLCISGDNRGWLEIICRRHIQNGFGSLFTCA